MRALPAAATMLPAGSMHHVQAGDTLWRLSHSFGMSVESLAQANHLGPGQPLSVGQDLFIPLPVETSAFLWPVHGRPRHEGAGLVLDVPEGTWVRTSRSGRVSAAAPHLAQWGPTVVVDHQDGTVTVYAGLGQLAATPGAWVRQGMPIGQAGPNGVYFEIRQGLHPQDASGLLPQG